MGVGRIFFQGRKLETKRKKHFSTKTLMGKYQISKSTFLTPMSRGNIWSFRFECKKDVEINERYYNFSSKNKFTGFNI